MSLNAQKPAPAAPVFDYRPSYFTGIFLTCWGCAASLGIRMVKTPLLRLLEILSTSASGGN